MLNRVRQRIALAEVKFCDRVRHMRHSGRIVASGRSSPLSTFVRDHRAPWRKMNVEPINMPGMITDEEARYYEYLGTLYEGRGAAIELGPWLGKSTRHIVRGLRKTPRFKRLYVFDDFIWRSSWMDQYVSKDLRPPNHATFRDIFESSSKMTQPVYRSQPQRLSIMRVTNICPRSLGTDSQLKLCTLIAVGRSKSMRRGIELSHQVLFRM